MKYLNIRNRFEKYNDIPFMTHPSIKIIEQIMNLIRAIIRRISYIGYSFVMAVVVTILVKDSKYAVLRELHYEDLRECMKRERM